MSPRAPPPHPPPQTPSFHAPPLPRERNAALCTSLMFCASPFPHPPTRPTSQRNARVHTLSPPPPPPRALSPLALPGQYDPCPPPAPPRQSSVCPLLAAACLTFRQPLGMQRVTPEIKSALAPSAGTPRGGRRGVQLPPAPRPACSPNPPSTHTARHGGHVQCAGQPGRAPASEAPPCRAPPPPHALAPPCRHTRR